LTLFEVWVVVNDFRVYVDGTTNLKSDVEHETLIRKCPQFQNTRLEGLFDLKDVPVGVENCLVVIPYKLH